MSFLLLLDNPSPLTEALEADHIFAALVNLISPCTLLKPGLQYILRDDLKQAVKVPGVQSNGPFALIILNASVQTKGFSHIMSIRLQLFQLSASDQDVQFYVVA